MTVFEMTPGTPEGDRYWAERRRCEEAAESTLTSNDDTAREARVYRYARMAHQAWLDNYYPDIAADPHLVDMAWNNRRISVFESMANRLLVAFDEESSPAPPPDLAAVRTELGRIAEGLTDAGTSFGLYYAERVEWCVAHLGGGDGTDGGGR